MKEPAATAWLEFTKAREAHLRAYNCIPSVQEGFKKGQCSHRAVNAVSAQNRILGRERRDKLFSFYDAAVATYGKDVKLDLGREGCYINGELVRY